MSSLARLQFDFDSAPAQRSAESLDKLTASAAKAQAGAEKLANASIKHATAQQAATTATAEGARQTLQVIQAEQRLEAIRLSAQISAEGRAQSLNRLAQLGRQAVSQTQAITAAEAQATQGQTAYNRSLETYAQVAARGIALQRQMAQGSQSAINSNLGVQDNFGGAGRAEDVSAYGAALDSLRAKYSPLFAASKQYESVLLEIDEAERTGAILAHEAGAAREMAAHQMANAGNAARGASGGFGAAGSSLANLSFQINDIATGLASGQSPFTILAQQGGQVFQIWQLNRGIFKELGSGLLSLITPARLLGGGVLAIGAALAYVAIEAIQTEKALDAALVGPGRAAGVTASQLQEMAHQAANASKIGVGSAREIAEAYASSGKITGESIERLTALTADYAATTHQSVGDASKNLVTDFSDLSSGITDLAKRLGGISPAQMQYIQNLIASGKNQKAVSAAIDAMGPSLTRHEEHLTLIGRLWATAKNAASDYNAAAEMAASPTTAQKLVQAQAMVRSLQQGTVTSFSPTASTGTSGDNSAAALRQAQQDVLRLQAQMRQEQEKAKAGAAAAASNQLAGELAPSITSLFPGASGEKAKSELQDLINLRDKYAKLMGDTTAQQADGISAQQAADGWNAYRRAVSSYITPAQMAQKQAQLEIAALNAKTPAQKAAVAAQQAALQLSGQAIVSGTLEAQVSAARAVAYAQAKKALDDQNKSIELNIASTVALAKAYQSGDIAGALEAQAKYQALAEQVGNPGIDVDIRKRLILAQAIGGQVDSLAEQMDTQTRANAITKIANDNVAAGVIPYDRLNDVIQQNIQLQELQALKQAAIRAGDMDHIALIDQQIEKLPQLTKEMQANADQAARLAALNPNASDMRLINGLQGEAARGEIAPDAATAAISRTSLRQSNTGLLTDLGQANPISNAALGAKGANQAIDDERAQRLQIAQDSIKDAQVLAEATVAIERDAAQKRLAVATQFEDAKLALGQNTFDSLATGLGDMFGKQSAAYKAAFAVEKAFQIARTTLALEAAIAQAAAAPFPANIPAIAQAISLGGQILSQLSSVTASGFANGVVDVKRQGGASSDTVLGMLTPGESVVNQVGTARNKNTLAAINAGASFDGARGGGGEVITVAPVFNIDARGAQQGVAEEITKKLNEAAPHIIGAAVNEARRQSPDWVASANKNPRKRARG